MLSDIFPRHVIEFISFYGLAASSAAAGSGPAGLDAGAAAAAALESVPEQMGQLARTHQEVSIMFMDIVGESLAQCGTTQRHEWVSLNLVFVDIFSSKEINRYHLSFLSPKISLVPRCPPPCRFHDHVQACGAQAGHDLPQPALHKVRQARRRLRSAKGGDCP